MARMVRILLATTIVAGAYSAYTDSAWASGGVLRLTVTDADAGRPVAARIKLMDDRGRVRRIPNTPFWNGDSLIDREISLRLPRGGYRFALERGPEYKNVTGVFFVDNFADDVKDVELHRAIDMAAENWWSGDLYLFRPLKDAPLVLTAEDLHVGASIVWRNGKPASSTAAPSANVVETEPKRFHHASNAVFEDSAGTIGFFNLPEAPLVNEGGGEDAIAELLNRSDVWIDVASPFSWDLPLWLATREIDSFCVANKHMHIDGMRTPKPNEGRLPKGAPADVATRLGVLGLEAYFHLLNCGFRVPPSAGSWSGAEPNPAGYNRMYVWVEEDGLTYEKWWDGFRKGRTIVSNGPLIQPVANNERPGHVFHVDQGETLEIDIAMNLATRDPISYLEIIKDGRVEQTIRLEDWAQTGHFRPIEFTESGWFLVRVVAEVNTTYRFAISAPWYVEVGYGPRRVSRESVEFYAKWLEERASRFPDKTEAAQARTEEARQFWAKLLSEANAP